MTAMLEVTGADGQNSPHPLAALGPRIGIREGTTISANERQGGPDAVWLSILAKLGMACASAGKDFDASAGPGQETEKGSPSGADLPV